MLKIGDIIDGKLVSLGYGGQALYKSKEIVLFVPRGLPEDEVRLRIVKLKKKYGSAEIVKILTPSPYRIDPGCQAFKNGCGGCQWLHFQYHAQLNWKTRIVRETLKHIGKLNLAVQPIIGMNKPFFYRNKLSLHRISNGKIGLMKENSHEIISFDQCLQEIKTNQEAYQVIRRNELPGVSQIHIRSNTTGETGLCLFGRKYNNRLIKIAYQLKKEIKNLTGAGFITHQQYHSLLGENSLSQVLNGITYQLPLNAFFQTNYPQTETLQTIVKKYLKPQKTDTVIDLYCGVGLFALDLACSVDHVYGIENNQSAIQAAEFNARVNKIRNTQFYAEDAEQGLKRFKKNSINALILDPPRTGCGRGVVNEIIRIQPQKMVYISCAPDTMARDLQILTQSGGYQLGECQPVDMFPQTYHVEMVVSLFR